MIDGEVRCKNAWHRAVAQLACLLCMTPYILLLLFYLTPIQVYSYKGETYACFEVNSPLVLSQILPRFHELLSLDIEPILLRPHRPCPD